jgi:hypothetical protein
VGFGFSMLFPLSTIFVLGFLTFLSLLRKLKLLRPYWRDIAIRAKLMEGHADPAKIIWHSRTSRKAIKKVKAEFAISGNPTLRSWSAGTAKTVWTGIGLAMLIPATFLWLNITSPGFIRLNLRDVQLANLAICFVTLGILYWALRSSNINMPTTDGRHGEELDDALAVAVTKLKDVG